MKILELIGNFFYNIDRAGASILGADPEETLSSQIGRRALKGQWFFKACAAVLNFLDHEHTTKAISRADGLRDLK